MIILNFRSAILSLVASLFPLLSHAEGIVVSFNDEDGVYRLGDKVVAYVVAERDMELTCELMEYGTVSISKEKISLRKGRKTILYSARHKAPCHYMFKLSYEGLEKPELAGFIVSPESYRAGYDCPENIRNFWDDQMSRMRKVKMQTSLAWIEDFHSETLECRDLTVNMHEGRPVRGYLCMPKDALPQSLPIVIYAHSAGVNKVFNYATTQRAADLAEKGGGCIVLDINAHGMENGQPQEYYDSLNSGELRGYQNRRITGHEDYYFRLMFLRLVRALDYLTTLPQWDGRRILIYGESQGGAQAMALAGIDERVGACVAIVPAMNDLGAFKVGRPASWPNVRESVINDGNVEVVDKVLPYYDAALLSTMSKADYWIEIGLADTTCPAPAIWSACNVIKGDVRISAYPFRTHYVPKQPYYDQWKAICNTGRYEWMNDYLK